MWRHKTLPQKYALCASSNLSLPCSLHQLSVLPSKCSKCYDLALELRAKSKIPHQTLCRHVDPLRIFIEAKSSELIRCELMRSSVKKISREKESVIFWNERHNILNAWITFETSFSVDVIGKSITHSNNFANMLLIKIRPCANTGTKKTRQQLLYLTRSTRE